MATALNDAYEHCMDAVREGDRDRFLATLFIPAQMRPHIFALRAFDLETAKVRALISEPLPGEIRLQWWRDCLSNGGEGDAVGHPVAVALIDTIKQHNLPIEALIRLIDARVFDLYDDPMSSVNDLEGYAGDTSASLYQLSSLILDPVSAKTTAEAAGHAGVLETLVGVLRSLSFHLKRGQVFLPEDVLSAHSMTPDQLRSGEIPEQMPAVIRELIDLADRHLDAFRQAHLPTSAMPAFLGLSLPIKYLSELKKAGPKLIDHGVELPQWRRQLILWGAARRGRL